MVDQVLAAAAAKGWEISQILNTHHHGDHTGGNLEIKQKTGCTIGGPKADRDRIPGIDVEVADGETYVLGDAEAKVFDVPGHTSGHIAFWFGESGALFCGDTLFAMGCGRLFEGSAEQMWSSLSKFTALPDATKIYCAHEYTLSNGEFALSVEPDNADLVQRMKQVREMRRNRQPTVPSTLAEEKRPTRFSAR